jgi:catechol 2,3-dioxygenase-like lactoylglutathione lyase family enzyme
MTFAHLTLATRDVQRTALFFEKTLGWPRVATPDNTPLDAAWVQMGRDTRQQVHILRVADFEPSPCEAEFGRHFAVFHAGSDFPALKRRLAEQGATVIDPIRPTPFERFFFRDPNGYVFEVIDRDGYDPEGSERRV